MRFLEESKEEFIQEVFQNITERLLMITMKEDQNNTNGVGGDGVGVGGVDTSSNDSHHPTHPPLHQRIWILYALYTFHECQITRRKRKIILPECKKQENEIWGRRNMHARAST